MKKFKKVFCLILAGIMTISLCSCGGKEEQASTEEEKLAAKQYVYSYEDIDLGVDLANVGMYNMSYYDGRIYMVLEDYSGTMSNMARTAEVAVKAVAEVMPEIDSDMSVDVEGVVPEEEYIYTGPQYYLYSVKEDGTDQKVTSLELGEEFTQGWLSNVSFLGDGTFVTIFDSYFEDYSDPENPIYMQYYYLMHWDGDGNKLMTIDMTPEDGSYIYIQKAFKDADGNLVMITGENKIYTYDMQGNEKSVVEIDAGSMTNTGQIIVKNDGTMYLTSYNDDWSKLMISPLDQNTGKVGDALDTPGNLSSYSIYAGETTDLLLSNSFGLYTYNIGDAEVTKMMDYVNSDLATYNLSNVTIMDDKSFIASYYNSSDYQTHVARFTYVDPADIPDKESLVLSCFYLGSDVKRRVIDFNKSSDTYRITIKSYMDSGDYNTGLTQMNNDIISGQMADIIVLDSSQDISGWVNKGLLADIEELIAKDEELSQNEYLSNVWEAFYINNKLYTLVPDFIVQTYVAKKDLVGDRTGWTMSEFQDFMKTMGEDVAPFGDTMLRDSFVYYLMLYCGSDFVDVNTGKCNFDSQEFVAMLEYAKNLETDYNDDYWMNYDWEAEQGKYRENRAVLMSMYISSAENLVYQIHGNLGAEPVYIGFPGTSGNSSVIQPGNYTYAISAKSKHQDGAWEFLRYYLTEEYQNSDNLWTLPVLKSAFEEKAQKAMEKPYWLDENGEKVEYDNTYYINGEEIILDQFTQEEVDAFCEFIYSVNKRSYYNQDIINIVTEEAAAFFEGQKSAQEVASVIQSRVQIYVDENR